MDCRALVQDVPERHFDLLLTDPPYGLDKKLSSGGGHHKFSKFRVAYSQETWDVRIENEWLARIRATARQQIIWGGNYYELPPTRCPLAWNKKQPFRTFAQWEMAWSNLNQPARMFEHSFGDKDGCHPTEKPLPLMQWCLSLVGQVTSVFDPFAGSGTTLVAAQRAGLKWIGVEINEKYCRVALDRLRQRQLI